MITEKATEKAAEAVIDKVSEGIIDKVFGFAKEAKDILGVEFGMAFDKYLTNSCKDLNLVKTIVDSRHFRALTGKYGIFVLPQVTWRDKVYDIEEYRDFIQFGKNIIICGTGGIGKTLLMKYLFINIANEGDYIPIYIRLRKYDKDIESTSLIDYINRAIGTYDVKRSKKQLEYCFSTGRMFLLFDGLDEVRHEKRRSCEEMIQDLQSKYPDNYYIVSSRHGGVSDAELKSFTVVELCPFDKTRACSLISLLTNENEKGKKFIHELNGGLYIKRKDFASNPLLLSIMFMSFDENNRVSNQILDFYDQAFYALYSKHDSLKRGAYVREYVARGLGMNMFKQLFSYVCFHSYAHNQYEFSHDEIIGYISKGIHKLNAINSDITKAEDFLTDLQEIVCLIVYEDAAYRFTHRSFQSYFTALYISQILEDEAQKRFSDELLSTRDVKDEFDFYKMLRSIQGENKFNLNVIFPALKKEIQQLDLEEMKHWDDAMLLKFYVESVTIKMWGNSQAVFMRQNSNHKENTLTLLLLFNNIDYVSTIGMAQMFSDDDEWNTLFSELSFAYLRSVHISMPYLLGEKKSEDFNSDIVSIFCNKLGREKVICFFIELFKVRQIHNIVLETYNQMLQGISANDKCEHWTDSL